jgi:hypothetical protein
MASIARAGGAAAGVGSAAARAGSAAAGAGAAASRGLGDLAGVGARGAGDFTGIGARGADDLAGLGRGADDLAGAAGAGAKKSSFLAKNANTLLAGGVAAGGLIYLDRMYAGAKEDVKDCMKVCLPDNWDDHAYGDLKSTELVYKELDDVGEQPVCTAQIEDCGKYCGEKCEDIHDYDAPGTNFLKGAGGDAAEGATDLFKSIFGDIFGDLGIDSTTMYASSSACSLCCCMLIIMMVVLK